MPPSRTQVKPFTPAKTERSHQENQERAYVAASRRSDRSLEARIESARRASEIHKQRTGRSLRITEAAVLNEEMYEEDDDDLPAHMRRLTAHLRLNQQDADLDRRLGSLLVSQIGMRQALPITQHSSFYRYSPNGLPGAFPSQSLQQSMGQPSPSTTNWSHDNSGGQHSRQGSMSHGGISPTQANKSRISPYPTPQSPYVQSQSPASVHSHSPYQTSSSLSSIPTLHHQRQDSMASIHPSQTASEIDTPRELSHDASPFVYGSPLCQDPASTIFPFTSALPMDTQQILAGSGLDFGDPTFGMMMPHGSDDFLRHDFTITDEKEQQDAANEEQFGAFWNDVMLGV